MPTFGAQLRAILEFNQAPAAEIADICGVSLKTAYSWIHDKAAPPRACEVLTEEEAIGAIQDHFAAKRNRKFAQQAQSTNPPAAVAADHSESF